MKLKKSPFHLFNKALLLAIVLLVVQQLIVASSTVWITRLIGDLQKETFSYSLLALYLASLFLPYLPAKHDLVFAFPKQELSTGQRARKVLEELLEDVEAPLLLLDEWDANLDQANKKQLSELIDKLSEKRCVIEVRH